MRIRSTEKKNVGAHDFSFFFFSEKTQHKSLYIVIITDKYKRDINVNKYFTYKG